MERLQSNDYVLGRLDGYLAGWNAASERFFEALQQEIAFELDSGGYAEPLKTELKTAFELIHNMTMIRFMERDKDENVNNM